jgi:D-alanyl-D-alanine carboxypeptidase
MMRRLSLLASCALFTLAAPPSYVQAAEETLALRPALRARLDAFVTAESGKTTVGAPAVSAAVVENGRLVYEGAAGLADVAKRLPTTPATRFRIGSVTKLFTAISIMQLVERGQIGLDDKLLRYLPHAPHAETVTVRELLNHTSGIPNYLDAAFAKGSVLAPATPQALLATVASKPLGFAPGTRYEYSNTGYVLLGLIVESLSGTSLPKYERAHILAPAGMSETDFGVPGPGAPLAVGYDDETGAPSQAFDPSWLYAGGDAVSTARDLARFDIALMSGKLVAPQTLVLMQADPVATGEGKERNGLGISIVPFGPQTFVGHHGGLPGFESDDEMLLDRHAAIVILGNSLGFRTSYLMSDFLAALFPAAFAAALAEAKAEIVEIAPGEDLAVSAPLRRTLGDLQHGTIDRTALSSRMNDALTPQKLANIAGLLRPAGVLESLIFRGKSLTDGFTVYKYVGIFSLRRLPLTLVLDKDGKIAGFFLR